MGKEGFLFLGLFIIPGVLLRSEKYIMLLMWFFCVCLIFGIISSCAFWFIYPKGFQFWVFDFCWNSEIVCACVCACACVWCWFMQMWPDLIQKAKEGGLDVIQTYVFWNGHEPQQGKVIISFTFTFFLSSLFFWNFLVIFFYGWIVLLWRKVWPCEIHQVGSTSWSLCSFEDWTLCLCWVEFWVISCYPFSSCLTAGNLFFFFKSWKNKIQERYFSPFVILLY